MEWLLTTSADVEADELLMRLREWGCPEQEVQDPIPLGEGEVVFEITGPKNLEQKALSWRAIHGVSPCSKMEFY